MMLTAIVILALLGLIISLYGMNVERNFKNNTEYKAACDISDAVSCTKAFNSPYNKMLGISNIAASLLYYTAMLFFGLVGNGFAALVLAWLGLCATVGFAYILYFKVRTVCLICTSLYVINIALVIVQYITL